MLIHAFALISGSSSKSYCVIVSSGKPIISQGLTSRPNCFEFPAATTISWFELPLFSPSAAQEPRMRLRQIRFMHHVVPLLSRIFKPCGRAASYRQPLIWIVCRRNFYRSRFSQSSVEVQETIQRATINRAQVAMLRAQVLGALEIAKTLETGHAFVYRFCDTTNCSH